MDRLILARHAETAYSARGLLNPDPVVDAPLSDAGEQAAIGLGRALQGEPVGVVATSPRARARRTAELLVQGRDVRIVELEELAEVGSGSFAGGPVEAYRQWVRGHPPAAAPPGGESVLDAAGRYVAGLRWIRGRPESVVLAVLHNLPMRMALNAASGEHPTAGTLQRMQHVARADLTAAELDRAIESLDVWRAGRAPPGV